MLQDTTELFRLVEKPEFMPHHCAITLREEDDQGFIDTGNELPVVGPRIYISIAGLKRLNVFAGISVEDQTDRVAELERELAEVTAERDRLAQGLDAVHVLKNLRFSPQRKSGRKPGDKTSAKNLGTHAVKNGDHDDWDEAA